MKTSFIFPQIHLSDNPVHCNERLAWIKGNPDEMGNPQLFANKNVDIFAPKLRCKSPEQLSGRLVLSLGKHEWLYNSHALLRYHLNDQK